MCSASESFGEAEFNYIRKWATGTVVGDQYNGSKDDDGKDKESDTEPEHPSNNDNDDEEYEIGVSRITSLMNLKCGAEGLGRACQRLIDYGRCEYIRKELLGDNGRVSLSHYVDKNITPQNGMLLGVYEGDC
jgi:tRNA:m4X modification enzyme